jgi:transcriptional regulator with XRE-family HTH domain
LPEIETRRTNAGADMSRKNAKPKEKAKMPMDFGELTQQSLAELINLHVIQVRRYESGASQPTLDVIRRLAVALQVRADVLIFGADERGPDGELLLQFEAISKFSNEEKKVIKALLEGMILKHGAKRWSSAA